MYHRTNSKLQEVFQQDNDDGARLDQIAGSEIGSKLTRAGVVPQFMNLRNLEWAQVTWFNSLLPMMNIESYDYSASLLASQSQSEHSLWEKALDFTNNLARTSRGTVDKASGHEQLEWSKEQLSGEQLDLFNFIWQWNEKRMLDPKSPGCLLKVPGAAGCGKTRAIGTAVQACVQRYSSEGPSDVKRRSKWQVVTPEQRSQVKVLASTGAAAAVFGFGASTAHSGLGIGIFAFEELTADKLKSLQVAWESVEIVIVDETSMVSRDFLSKICLRLKQLKCSDLPFGGVLLILAGDFAQLKCVNAMSLMSLQDALSFRGSTQSNKIGKTQRTQCPSKTGTVSQHGSRSATQQNAAILSNQGRDIYWSKSNQTIMLTKVHRQVVSADLTPTEANDQKKFVDLLPRLRFLNQLTKEDCQHLAKRSEAMLSSDARLQMDDATWLVESNAAVHARCLRKLHSIANIESNPIFVITAQCSPPVVAEKGAKDCGGLVLRLVMCIGAPILILRNISTRHRIVNGSRGICREIWYPEGQRPGNMTSPTIQTASSMYGDVCLPIVICEIPSYTGPSFFNSLIQGKKVPIPGREKWVPIVPYESPVDKVIGGKRIQLPLLLAYALTVWKCQGMSLESAVIQIRDRLSEHGLLYVAISRIKLFHKLFFQHCPSYNEIAAASHTLDALHFLGSAGRLVFEAQFTQRHSLRRWSVMERHMADFICSQWMKSSSLGLSTPEVSIRSLWHSWQAEFVLTQSANIFKSPLLHSASFLNDTFNSRLKAVCKAGFWQGLSVLVSLSAFGRVFEHLCYSGLQQAAVDIYNSAHGLVHFKAGRGTKRALSLPSSNTASKRSTGDSTRACHGTPDALTMNKPIGFYNVSNNCWLSSSWQCLVR